ncbi:glycoside hydrolase family 130 protein [Flavobacterium agrisoli]|uniref:Pesticidal protein Cry7Aa n=1 Tax=Flavobacterium agrisoli TaxID=2793066 RepID=A0A934PNX8_9FLAO|nr:pesticidal protein Cry7Aa [Flavobacterium agrisoli]MBK0369898.1 pesticidal protein Cry7Aa [Flavobacterium agrisoli]
MKTLIKHGVILKRTNLDFENLGVLNPAVYQEGNTVHLFYRAAHIGNFSSIGYCQFDGPLRLVRRDPQPLVSPEFIYESHGVEDPRITKIDDTYYLSYAAYDGINAFGALATSKELPHFEKKGIITPKFTAIEYHLLLNRREIQNDDPNALYLKHHQQHHPNLNCVSNDEVYVWDKNVVFFPRRIQGKLVFFHRLLPAIQLVMVDKLEDLTRDYWADYIRHLDDHTVLSPKFPHETSHIGAGCPPIETPDGWLVIYHATEKRARGLVYHACAALLDLENPMKVLARLEEPIISPSEYYEKHGYVNYVVFPTGTALFDDRLYIYYGAADDEIAVASIVFDELLNQLKAIKNENDNS